MNYKYVFKTSILLLCGFGLLCGCQESKNLGWSESGFPEREIVFEVISDDSVFGFINPDGTGLVTRTIAPEAYAGSIPAWSPNGKFIAFRSEYAGRGYFNWMRMRAVSAKGETVGWCEGEKFRGTGRVWITWDDKLLFPLYSAQEGPCQIVLADLESCKVLSILYEAPYIESEYLDSATLSSQGWLAVSRVFLENAIQIGADIIVIDPESKEEQVVGHGLAPAWSKDGEWLAFTDQDGLYIVYKDGSQMRKLVDIDASPNDPLRLWSNDMSIASWSPDGKWLIYDRLTSDGPVIYKVNVESGEEIKVFQGGMYPNWRWDLDANSE